MNTGEISGWLDSLSEELKRLRDYGKRNKARDTFAEQLDRRIKADSYYRSRMSRRSRAPRRPGAFPFPPPKGIIHFRETARWVHCFFRSQRA